MNIQEKIDFVKRQISYNQRQRQIADDRSEKGKASFRTELIEKFQEILDDYENLLATPQSSDFVTEEDSNAIIPPVSRRFGDLSDLPQELLDELSISDSDKYSMQICDLLESAGEPLNIDQILIGLYRKYNRLEKRTPLTTKLYRMQKAEELYSVPNKKGVYSLLPVSEEESE